MRSSFRPGFVTASGVVLLTCWLGACGEEEDTSSTIDNTQPPGSIFGTDGGTTASDAVEGQGDTDGPWGLPRPEPGLPDLILGDKAGSGTDPSGGIWERWDLEIAGIWLSNFGEAQTITSLSWNKDQNIVTWDNASNGVVTQNHEDAPYYPGAYNRIVWTEPEGGGFWHCTIDFGEESLEQIQRFDKVPDASSPDTSGCGGFAWTRLEEAIEVAGSWDLPTTSSIPTEGSLEITPETWNETSIEYFSNNQNWVITRNPPDAFYFPDHYNKVLWTHAADGTLLVCTIDKELESLEEVVDSEYVANALNPLLAGCRGEPWVQWEPAGPEIAGNWEGEWGALEVTWALWGTTEMVLFDNDENWAITRNADDDTWNPGTYTRRLWTEPVDGLWHTCDGAFGLESLEEAVLTEWVANADDLDSGCGEGGFSWSMYWAVPIEVRGSWASDWGTEDITNHEWAGRAVISFDNLTNRAILQSPSDAEWNPDKFSRFLWTELEGGEFHYCEDVYGKNDAGDITSMIDVGDPADLEAGCGGFPWTRLWPAPIEVTGAWANDGGEVDIVDDQWGPRAIDAYDNLANEAILLNPADAAVEPSTYLRVRWTTIADDAFFSCTDTSNHLSSEEAANVASAVDPSDITAGCAGGPWTKHWLAPIELLGSWTVDGETLVVAMTTWGPDAIQSYDNLENRVIVQLAPAEDGTPGLFARRVWTEPVSGIALVCEDATGMATAVDAEAAPSDSDPLDQTTGCGEAEGPWILMALQ